jgi:hypothetical protein
VRIIKEGLECGMARSIDSSYFEEKDADEIAFSLKNYESKTGLSSKIFRHKEE